MGNPSLMTAEQRQHILRCLKKGPQLDRQELGQFAAQLYEQTTKKKLHKECDKLMEHWRQASRGRAEWNQTFIH